MFKLGSLAEFPVQLTRRSLGEVANIGDTYDATTDCFTGQSVITGSTGSPAVSSTVTKFYEDGFLVDATACDRLALLVNDKELQLNVFLRMVVPERNIRALVGLDDNTMFLADGILLRTFKILREEMKNSELLISSYSGAISERATHVVVGVEWGATVAVCFDRKDTNVPAEQPSNDILQRQLQTLMTALKCESRPNAQVISDMSSTYTIRCFSNGLPQDNQAHTASVDDAIDLLSNLPRLIQSKNNGKGAPQAFILMPLSSLTKITAMVPRRVEWCILTQILDLCRDLEMAHSDFTTISQYLERRKSYWQEHAIDRRKIDEFLTKFQDFKQAKVKLYDEVVTAVVAVRSNHHDHSCLADIIRTFSYGGYSVDRLKAILVSMEPTVQKMKFLDEIIVEGVVIIGDSRTHLGDVKHHSDVYILYATENAKQQHPALWKDNSAAFLDTVRHEKRKHERRSSKGSSAIFAYIDCDIVPGANIDEGIAIHHYKDGKVLSRDAVYERAVIASMNIAESSQKKQAFKVRPFKVAVVEMECPGAIKGCDSSRRIWSCEACKEQMEYGFDEYFYCSCGRANVNTFSYKCNGTNHGDVFLAFQSHNVVKAHVESLKPKILNILLLGETGVGKSTFINGVVNYITYTRLDEAENQENVCVIPTKFTMTNEKYEPVVVQTGTDKNEDQQDGQSSTQMPKTYCFQCRGMTIRIIDTPGVGDTRSIDYDRTNFQNIMTHLREYDEINGICILLKPNNARLTVTFKYCIKELLTHLHRDACKNIVFCFTNARGTFYKPGDTLPALTELIAKSTDIDLRLCKETIYCIDNESVRFLAALKQKVQFGEDERKNYSTSWDTSVKETLRLLDYISSLQPHIVKNTLSLNDARRLVVALSRPLAEITSIIQSNISVVEDRRRELEESMKRKEQLNTRLFIPVIDLETKPLAHPRTVCTAKSCVKHISFEGVNKIDHIRHCHPHCTLTGVETNVVNCVALQGCLAMNESHQCRHCGCSWSVHMHITYESAQVPKQIVDENVERELKEKTTNIQKIQQNVQPLKDRVQSLENEKHKVVKVSAKFGCFLKHNAIATVNDSIGDYLEQLIDLEKGKVNAGADKNTLKGLEIMKQMYEEEMKTLQKAISHSESSVSVPTAGEIRKLYQDLCKLPITGPILKKTMATVETADAEAMQMKELRIIRPSHFGTTFRTKQESKGNAKALVENVPGLGRLMRMFRR